MDQDDRQADKPARQRRLGPRVRGDQTLTEQTQEDWELRAAKLQLLRPEWYNELLRGDWAAQIVVQRPSWWQSLGCGEYTRWRLTLLIARIQQREKEFKSAHRSVACDAPNQGKILVTPEDEHLIEFAINNAGQV
jgi:hypothetical protein